MLSAIIHCYSLKSCMLFERVYAYGVDLECIYKINTIYISLHKNKWAAVRVEEKKRKRTITRTTTATTN